MPKENAANLTPEDDRPTPPPEPTPRTLGGPGPGEELVADVELPGPDFDPAPEVSESQIRGVLRMIGRTLHRTAGDPRFPDHWDFTPEELDDLAPPFASIVNRSPALRRAVERSDYATLTVALLGWTMRNVDLTQTIAEEEAAYSGSEEPPPPEPPPPAEEEEGSPPGPLYQGGGLP